MTEIKQNGLVIAERDLGENDKLLTILVERYGKLCVVAKGAKSVKNRHIPSTQLFAYSTFGLRKRGNYYYITDSDLVENFYEIRSDILKLALASYMCDVVSDVAQEDNNENQVLRLILNMLFSLAKDIHPVEMIKAVFEIRLASELGFAPDIEVCFLCHKKEASTYFFDIIDGVMTCDACKSSIKFSLSEEVFAEKGLSKPLTIVSSAVVDAINYVIYSKQEKILSFSLDKSQWTSFFDTAEKFLLNHLERGFFSLDFYKSLLL